MTLENGCCGRFLNAKWIFLPAFWGRAGSGILSCRRRGWQLDCSWTLRPGVFWFSLKFSGCLSGLLHWLWLCVGAGCAVLSASHTHQITVALKTRESWRWGNRLIKGSCSAAFVWGTPSTTAELEFGKVLNTDGEKDIAELGTLLQLTLDDRLALEADRSFLAAVRGSLNVSYIHEWDQPGLIIFLRCWYPHMPKEMEIGWQFSEFDRVNWVERIWCLNVNFFLSFVLIV